MVRLLVKHLLMALMVVVAVLTITFILMRFSGDPVSLLLPPDATVEERTILRQDLGLDRPLVVQYFDYMTSIARGDFGRSYFESEPVASMVGRHFVNTAQLALTAFGIIFVLALPLGLICAIRRGGVLDRIVQAICTISVAMPTFWVGLLLIQLFAVQLRLLPSFGAGTLGHLVLPAATLAFAFFPSILRLTRSAMLEVLAAAYVKTARAKGLPEHRVLSRTVFRNGIVPVIPLLGIELGALLGGAVVTETVFSWPGIGYLAVRAIDRRDFPVVEGVVVYIAIIFVLITLIVEISTLIVNPRLRAAK